MLATTSAEADLVAGRAEAAVPVVRDVLPQWDGKLVVEVPGSEEALDAALGAEPGSYADIAAVTASVDGTITPDSEVHVFVNPDVYDDLEPVGGQVVISHEATHLATGAPLTSGVPLWLLEGFADYVALHAVDLPITTTAGQIIQQVRADGAPDHLPGQPEFDQADSHLGAAYESAWVACLVLADAGGQDALVRLYEAVSRGQELDGQLPQAVRPHRGRADGPVAAAAPGPCRAVDRRHVTSAAVDQGAARLAVVPARRIAAAVAVVGALAFVVIAVLLVPWDPIPGGPLHPPSASSVFTAEQIQRAEDYSGAQRLLSWASLAVSLAVACVLGFSRVGARFVDRVRGPWWWRVVVAVAALAVVGRLATLPFSIVLRHRALEFGLTNQAWGAYAVDLAKGLAVEVVATSIALVVLVGVARRWPRAWPAAAGAAPGRAGDARLVRLPAAGRAAVQPLRTAAGRPAPHPGPRAGRPGGRARWTTCWWPTRRDARRR